MVNPLHIAASFTDRVEIFFEGRNWGVGLQSGKKSP